MMDLYFEVVVLIVDEFVDRYQSIVWMMIDDWTMHREYHEVTKEEKKTKSYFENWFALIYLNEIILRKRWNIFYASHIKLLNINKGFEKKKKIR